MKDEYIRKEVDREDAQDCDVMAEMVGLQV